MSRRKKPYYQFDELDTAILEHYRDFISNQSGDDIEVLLSWPLDTSAHSVYGLMQVSVASQLQLMRRLYKAGFVIA